MALRYGTTSFRNGGDGALLQIEALERGGVLGARSRNQRARREARPDPLGRHGADPRRGDPLGGSLLQPRPSGDVGRPLRRGDSRSQHLPRGAERRADVEGRNARDRAETLRRGCDSSSPCAVRPRVSAARVPRLAANGRSRRWSTRRTSSRGSRSGSSGRPLLGCSSCARFRNSSTTSTFLPTRHTTRSPTHWRRRSSSWRCARDGIQSFRQVRLR